MHKILAVCQRLWMDQIARSHPQMQAAAAAGGAAAAEERGGVSLRLIKAAEERGGGSIGQETPAPQGQA